MDRIVKALFHLLSKEDNPQHALFLQIQASWKDLRSELLNRSREGNNQ